ncbi:MAG: hypothetical protein JWR37_1174 [Mycobacterium sp.]|jgi:hypothetical protein|nr:hypothetical protein [Mycobacterium sp.]
MVLAGTFRSIIDLSTASGPRLRMDRESSEGITNTTYFLTHDARSHPEMRGMMPPSSRRTSRTTWRSDGVESVGNQPTGRLPTKNANCPWVGLGPLESEARFQLANRQTANIFSR